MKNPDGMTLNEPVLEDATGKTVVFTHKQVEQIKEQMTGKEKKPKKSKKQKQKPEPAEKTSKKNRKKRKQDEYREVRYEDDPDEEYEDMDVAAGLQKALNIGLVIVILIVVLFVLEFVLSSMGMFKGISQYLPSADHIGEWFGNVLRKLNSMNIGQYLRDGVARIMEIFRR